MFLIPTTPISLSLSPSQTNSIPEPEVHSSPSHASHFSRQAGQRRDHDDDDSINDNEQLIANDEDMPRRDDSPYMRATRAVSCAAFSALCVFSGISKYLMFVLVVKYSAMNYPN